MPPNRTSWTLPEQFDEYRLIRMLGRGNMGVVFLGHDLVLDRQIAIKFLNNVDADPRARERFLTEARAAARIHHPNVMAIYRVGELEGRLYIIGEYIRGISLSELPRPIPWQSALKIAVDLARGLACAHRQGVLHRDIKLANAMQSESGEVKLLDFSLAKLLEGAAPVADVQVTPSVPAELESTLDPAIQIDAGAKGGRIVDSSLHASPRSSGKISDLGSTMTNADPQAIQRVRRSESSDGVVVGTPFYMAPELWRAVPASRTTDVYAVGVLLYILCSNQPPIDGRSTLELARLSQEQRPRPLRALVPTVDPRFAEIVDRCLRPASEDRYTSGDELCAALEGLASEGTREATAVVHGNPYRGLQAFEARHRAVFFGRSAEIRSVTDRLRAEPFLLVAGDSGVGKSSLCRAGVLPGFTELATEGRAWSTLSLMPGRRPLQTLVSALAGPLKLSEEFLRDLFESDPGELIRTLVRHQGKTRGLVLFIDQLEELVTLAEPVQRIAVGRFFAEVASGLPGVRLLATARGDFLTRVAALPEVGRYINAAIYLLTPLTPEGVREAIVGPARLQGVNFESEELIETLGTAGVENNLPLLQFALAELWEARDPATRRITAADLERIGRVTGALTRHADNVVASLPASQRVAVRRLLMRLVTIEDTRASLPLEDLVLGDTNNETALEALVRGRLVVVREAQDGTVYEIAHEALIRNWDTLQRWITEERETREIYHRLEIAALEWQRLGSGRDGLWTAEQRSEADRLDSTNIRQRERDFLGATQAELVRLRWVRRGIFAAVPLVLGLVYAVIRVQDARSLAHRIDRELGDAAAVLQRAREHSNLAAQGRAQAFDRYDNRDVPAGDLLWRDAVVAGGTSDGLYKQASQSLDVTLRLDPTNARARTFMADTLFERASQLEALGKTDLASELVERLKLYDEGEHLARWTAPAKLRLTTDPPGATVAISQVTREQSRLLVAGVATPLGVSPISDLELAQGSSILTITADGRETVTVPLWATRGEALDLDLVLPRAGEIPADYAYVTSGKFLFGANTTDELQRRFFTTVPMHAVDIPHAYLIGRHEVTYGEWIEFLKSLSPIERRARMAAGDSDDTLHVGTTLSELADGSFRLTVSAGEARMSAAVGELLRYAERSRNHEQDWLRIPVSRISWPDAKAYIAWLDSSGRLPGARFCTDWEWEKAARGADGRTFPHGDWILPEEANIDKTYGSSARTGPDMVGLHPESRSPYGLDDAAGNVWEWVMSSVAIDEPTVRSGAFFYDEITCTTFNRYIPEPDLRDSTIGLRVCASWSPPGK